MMKIYKWTEKENKTFEIVTDDYQVYSLQLKAKEKHFERFCNECKDIYELCFSCLSGKPKKDDNIKNTIKAILEQSLSERCESLVFICDNRDGRSICREVLFDRWFDEEESETIEKYVKSLCEDEQTESCLNMYFIADKDCDNFGDNLEDFYCNHQ